MDMNAGGARLSTVRDLGHVWVGCEVVDGGDCQYVKRWKRQGMPWAEYWPVREHSLLVRLAEAEARHVVEVVGIDARHNEVRTRDAGISLDRLDCRVAVWGEDTPHPHPFFDVTELLKLMRWTIVALEEIHALGLVHCDLSPGNVCLPLVCGADGWRCLDYSRLKLIDFAFALHRDLPLRHPLPVDTAAPELYCLPPFFRAAVVRDQKEERAIHAQRVMGPCVDLYSLGMIAQTWYRAGFRPHPRIPAATVETLFRRVNRHGQPRAWWGWRRSGARQLRERIDRLLERADTDPGRSADFRFLAAEVQPLAPATAITPLLTRIRPVSDARQPRVDVATIVLPPDKRNPADVARALSVAGRARAHLLAPATAPVAARRPAGWRRALSTVIVSALGTALFFASPGSYAPPAAPAATRADQVERWIASLTTADERRRRESAQALARLARAGGEDGAVAGEVAARLEERLRTEAVDPSAYARHAEAWSALGAVADEGGELAPATAARRALEAYERRAEALHGRLGGLVFDTAAQARAPEWNEYVLRLTTLAHGGSARGALMLGLIESSRGRDAEAFRHLRQALLQGEDRRAASEEMARLLQRLVDAGQRQALSAVVSEVEAMAEQRYPRWQIWAGRINDVLGQRERAASWYRRVNENTAAGRAEKDYARAEMARLVPGS